MAKRITDLPELPISDSNDLIPIVDVSGNITKRVQVDGVVRDGIVTPAKLSSTFSYAQATFSTSGSTGGQVIGTSVAQFNFDVLNSNGTTGVTNGSGLLTVTNDGIYMAILNTRVEVGAGNNYRLRVARYNSTGSLVEAGTFTQEFSTNNGRSAFPLIKTFLMTAGQSIAASAVCSGNTRFAASTAADASEMSLTLVRIR